MPCRHWLSNQIQHFISGAASVRSMWMDYMELLADIIATAGVTSNHFKRAFYCWVFLWVLCNALLLCFLQHSAFRHNQVYVVLGHHHTLMPFSVSCWSVYAWVGSGLGWQCWPDVLASHWHCLCSRILAAEFKSKADHVYLKAAIIFIINGMTTCVWKVSVVVDTNIASCLLDVQIGDSLHVCYDNFISW